MQKKINFPSWNVLLQMSLQYTVNEPKQFVKEVSATLTPWLPSDPTYVIHIAKATSCHVSPHVIHMAKAEVAVCCHCGVTCYMRFGPVKPAWTQVIGLYELKLAWVTVCKASLTYCHTAIAIWGQIMKLKNEVKIFYKSLLFYVTKHN